MSDEKDVTVGVEEKNEAETPAPAPAPTVDLAMQNEQTIAQTNAINDAVAAAQVQNE